MNPVFGVIALLLAGGAAAQTAPDRRADFDRQIAIMWRGIEAIGEGTLRSAEVCDGKTARVPYPYAYKKDLDTPVQEQTREALITITAWTGGCKDGKRDGQGELSWRVEQNEAPGSAKLTEWRTEGRMVAGRMIGLICVREHRFSINGNPISGPSGPAGSCGLSTGNFDLKGTGSYRKLPDGRWQQWAGNGPAEPAGFLAPGELEARSERMVAAALASNASVRADLRIETRALDDLVRGATITLAPDPGVVSLKGKRVAVVLSSRTLAELEQFKRERQVLIDKTLGMSGEAAKIRARFITASNPDRMLESVARLLRGLAGEVLPLDSLAEMQAARADYALVIDWKSHTRMDLLGKYDAFPVGKLGDPESAIVGFSLSGYLIEPPLRAVRQYVTPPSTEPRFSQRTGVYESGDSGYLLRLVQHFESAWGRAAGDAGTMTAVLKAQLERN